MVGAEWVFVGFLLGMLVGLPAGRVVERAVRDASHPRG